ncbi:MAG TPA: hypothetical protein V6C72_13835, partial [Chroococcales cyanobacterium]
GSRLFYISSAPFCMLLALLGSGCAAAARHRLVTFTTACGAAALTALFLTWVWVLEKDTRPWFVAGVQMQKIEQRLERLAASIAPGKKVLLLELPQDYQGAGLITRSQYLDQIARPPFTKEAYADKLITVEPIIFGSHQFVWPGELRRCLNEPLTERIFKWNCDRQEFFPWQPAGDAARSAVVPVLVPAATAPAGLACQDADQWHVASLEGGNLERHDRFLRILPPSGGDRGDYFGRKSRPAPLTVWYDLPPLDSTIADYAELDFDISGDRLPENKVRDLRLVWRSAAENDASVELDRKQLLESPPCKAKIVNDGSRGHHVWLGRYRQWALSRSPVAIGLQLLPGDYAVDLRSIKIVSDALHKPTLTVSGRSSSPGSAIPIKPSEPPPTLVWDAANIDGARHVELVASQSNLTFDANVEDEIESGPLANVLEKIPKMALAGQISLSAFKLDEGTHQIKVVATDAQGRPVGLPSEPISVKLSRAR